MRAVETFYAGCRFRSRLEARWAVFFDVLGVRWDYEPEGFELAPLPASEWEPEAVDHLGAYLPDFYLPELETYFEVKGAEPDQATQDRLYRFHRLIEPWQRLIVAVGSFPDPDTFDRSGHPVAGAGAFDLWLNLGDFHYAWCVCPWCGKPGIEFDARGARVCGWKAHGLSEDEAWEIAERQGHWRIDDKCYTGHDPRILEAYRAGRSARFEHGERGR